MIKGIESILLFSENSQVLAAFYSQKVGLKQTMEMEIGEKEEKGFAFEMKGCSLYILHHSKVSGKNKESERIIFNLETNNIEEEVKKLDKAGVKKVQDIYHMENYGNIATFEDTDGNYFQLVQVKT